MDNILQDFYHGRIHPEETYRPMLEAHNHKRKQMVQRQEKLIERIEKLDPDIRREFDDLLDEIGMVEAMEMEDIYTQGMRMGARLAMALMGKAQA